MKLSSNQAEQWLSTNAQFHDNSSSATSFQVIELQQQHIPHVGTLWRETEHTGIISNTTQSSSLHIACCNSPEDVQAASEAGYNKLLLAPCHYLLLKSGRVRLIREILLAGTTIEREAALQKLLPLMTAEYEHMLDSLHRNAAIHGYVRLLDAPIVLLLPSIADLDLRMEVIQRFAADSDRSMERHRLHQQWLKLKQWKQWLHSGSEVNCMLSNTVVEWIDMQAEALFRAEQRLAAQGYDIQLTVLLPYEAGCWKQHVSYVRLAAEQILGVHATRNYPIVGIRMEQTVNVPGNTSQSDGQPVLPEIDMDWEDVDFVWLSRGVGRTI
ncbi:hypothetical protein [Paenibacillus alvei]|uniref:hypothetical protein n=1 Tax=Paenibacillus alvei TaxID=44250 RepID=UPI0013DB3313|nr:hypothetical protein [Paenibacillus alvei]NEZ43774.1 hypothetical protein [Paenibacillus alvei]